MKIFLILFFGINGLFAFSQYSPYFYRNPSSMSQGITDDIHAYYLKRFFFRPYTDDDRDEKNAKNVIKKKEHEFVEFNANGNIYFTAYTEQPLQYYYDKYLGDPKKVKADWDYTPNMDAKDYTYYANHPNMEDKSSKVLGAYVFVIKVDGNRAAAFYHLLAKTDFCWRTQFTDNIWGADLSKIYDKKRDEYRERTPKEKYETMSRSDYYYPLMYYMRDNGTPGSHKIELEVYPASLNAKTTADHSTELVCKGEFILTLSQKDLQELKEAGGPKNEEEVNTTSTAQGYFYKIKQ
jgi:hypothetical protein